MTDRTLLGIVGSVSADSRTRTAVEVALDAAADRHDVETEVLHLADYDLATADGRGIDNYEGDTAEALELVVEADAYVVGTPVYRGSYSARSRTSSTWFREASGRATSLLPSRTRRSGSSRPARRTTTSSRSIRNSVQCSRSSARAHGRGRDVRERRRLRRWRTRRRGEIRERLATLGEATVELSAAIDNSEALGSLGPAI